MNTTTATKKFALAALHEEFHTAYVDLSCH
jgi:hypothetical protein